MQDRQDYTQLRSTRPVTRRCDSDWPRAHTTTPGPRNNSSVHQPTGRYANLSAKPATPLLARSESFASCNLQPLDRATDGYCNYTLPLAQLHEHTGRASKITQLSAVHAQPAQKQLGEHRSTTLARAATELPPHHKRKDF
jgi:hypothetical protein